MDDVATINFVSGKMRCLSEDGYHLRYTYVHIIVCIQYNIVQRTWQVDEAFCFDSIVCGHQVYKTRCVLYFGGDPDAMTEHKNEHGRYAVCVN